jgi:uncharacterized membrane protein YgcG
MNNKRLLQFIFLATVVSLFSLTASAARAAQKGGAKITRNQFFIVSEVNLGQNQVVFEAPTQITATMTVNGKTVFTNQQGKRMPISDLQAGDTGYLTYEQKGNDVTALSFRLGPMNMALLRQDYLNGTPPPVPVTSAPVAPAPSSFGGRGGRGRGGFRGGFGGRRGFPGGGGFGRPGGNR